MGITGPRGGLALPLGVPVGEATERALHGHCACALRPLAFPPHSEKAAAAAAAYSHRRSPVTLFWAGARVGAAATDPALAKAIGPKSSLYLFKFSQLSFG